jgi:uncharacterized protein
LIGRSVDRHWDRRHISRGTQFILMRRKPRESGRIPMDATERQVIDELFGKLRQVESQTGPREPQAEAYIRGQISRQPAAPYYMAQAIVMQEQALAAATARIEEMERERQAGPAGGGFLAGLFGGSGAPAAGRRSHAAPGDPRVAAYARPEGAAEQRPSGGSGFLAGAMQTAVGVAGGMVLANALGGMFGADEAAAAEPGSDASFDDASGGSDDTSGSAGFDAEDGDFGSFDDF